MAGTGARRRCAACEREVLDLSAMRAEAAIDALIARDGRACIRYRTDAAGEIQFAPAPPRRPGPIAAAAIALTTCAGWAEDPATVSPDELGVCIPDADDPNTCDPSDAPRSAKEPPGSREQPRDSSPSSTASPTDRDFTASVEIVLAGDGASVPPVNPHRAASDVTISGVVSDTKTGEKIGGALVILQCTCLQGQREVQTNADGQYSLRNLRQGKYTVQVLFGQANVNKSMDVPPGSKFRANFSIDSDMDHLMGMLVVAEHDPRTSLFDRKSTAGRGSDWYTTLELLRMKRQLRSEERQRRREDVDGASRSEI